jgi:hypothetical protein
MTPETSDPNQCLPVYSTRGCRRLQHESMARRIARLFPARHRPNAQHVALLQFVSEAREMIAANPKTRKA